MNPTLARTTAFFMITGGSESAIAEYRHPYMFRFSNEIHGPSCGFAGVMRQRGDMESNAGNCELPALNLFAR
jgi:hypothetical protein